MVVASDKQCVILGTAMLLTSLLVLVLLIRTPAADVEQMRQSVVRLDCHAKGKARVTSGSGFVVGSDTTTHIVTNFHVVADCARPEDVEQFVAVLGPDEKRPVQVEWQSSDPDRDVAVVRTDGPTDRPAVQIADTRDVAPGAPITIIGFPGAADAMAYAVGSQASTVPSLARGDISRILPPDGKQISPSDSQRVRYFQHTAATNPGNSGGPVFDEAGNVIGINTLKPVTGGEGIAAALDVGSFLPDLRAAKVPYVMVITLTPLSIATLLAAAAVAMLLAAGGIVLITPSGRAWVFGRAPAIKAPRTVAAQAGKIRVLGGALAGKEIPIATRIVLGRDPAQAQIVFPSDDTAVSRRHCEIRFDSSAALFEIRDLGSTNGTFVINGPDQPRRLAPKVMERVAPGQNILVGSSRNRLVLELR